MKTEKNQQPTQRMEKQKASIVKAEANRKLDTFQRYIGIALLTSSIFGIYLLTTDKSLWLLAISHAYGLLAICMIDISLGLTNLFASTRKVILPSYGWAFLTVLLQLGDIATAPQYRMTSEYFASYLFHLWAYDAILLAQGAIIVIGFSARKYQKVLARKKQVTYFEMGFKKGRRDFMQIVGGIGALLVLAGALGAWDVLSAPMTSASSNNSGTSSNQSSNLPSGAIANTRDLQVGVPVYFDYPSGYPNMLLKKSDGTVSALSMLCTHVCCQVQYDSASTDIYCPCHGSIFNQYGDVLRGPAPTKLPSIKLNIDSVGNIFPVKIDGSSPCLP